MRFLIALLFITMSAWSTDNLLRKNDQATIIAGALDWARDARQDWDRYYQFDKTYVLYTYLTTVLKVNDARATPVDPVRAANIAVAATFWLALLVFVAAYRRVLSSLALLTVLAAPALLFNTQYVNSTTLSSAFLLLGVSALRSARTRWFAPVLCFLSVGARADIVLLLPLWCWLITPSPKLGNLRAPHFQRLKRHGLKASNNDWNAFALPCALVASALMALLVGHVWAGEAAPRLDPFFQWQMAAGYIVFGFGAATALYLIYATRLFARALITPGVGPATWALGGALAFLLPLVFFLPQLHAPRYFWRICEAIWLVAALKPDLAVLPWRGVRPLVAAMALLPLMIGLHVPDLRHPRLTVSDPTLFPSGDGHYPMGAYIAFLHALRQGGTQPIDHNQRVWDAVRGATFEPDSNGAVRILFTPMYGYFMLEGAQRRLRVEWDHMDNLEGTLFHTDSRTLARQDVKFPFAARTRLLEKDMQVISPVIDGITVLCVGRGDRQWGRRTQLLNRLFEGNEYRTGPADAAVPEGRHVVWFASTHFDGATRDDATGWFYRREPAAHADVEKAWSALPSWMNVQRFNESK